MWKRKTPMEKELALLARQEARYLKKRQEQSESGLNEFLADKVPDKLQGTLERAFEKAFALVFEKGAPVIEKTYNKEEIEKNYKIKNYAAQLKGDRKSLKEVRNQAANAGKSNTLASAAAGLGMGVIGVGIPDIPVFTGFLLRSIYQIALKYGCSYETENEKKWIMLLIQGAVAYGKEQKEIDRQIDVYLYEGQFVKPEPKEEVIKKTARALSKEFLYTKFLQGIPVVGVIGGAYDFKYMNEITTYAELKYRKRYYAGMNV